MDPAPEELLAIRDGLMQLVEREYAHLRRFYEQLWRQPLARRVQRGWAIDSLRLRGSVDRKRGIARFACPRNDSRFRSGDLLRLSRNRPSGPDAFEVTWYGEEDDWVGVTFHPVGRLSDFLESLRPEDSWTLDASYMDLQGLYERALDQLTQSAIGRDRILPLLAGKAAPTIDLSAYEIAHEALSGRPANDVQREAAAMALAAQPYAMIQGPPGTGKTQTLALVAEHLVLHRGERVLISGLTHRAIHEALNKVSTLLGPDRVAKVGVPVYDPNLLPKDYRTFSECPLAESAEGYVVGATPFSLWSRRLDGYTFDTLIIDESSQVTPPLAAMAMLKAERYVFIGDHQQLPPVLSHLRLADEVAPETQSIFSRLHDASSSTLLTRCYRMNASLCEWPSRSFYQGRLHAAADNAERRLAWPQPQERRHPAWDAPEATVCIRLFHESGFTDAPEEAQLVSQLVRDWIVAGHDPSRLGVVVPYRRQANLIRRHLRREKGLPAGQVRQVTVDTVDRFQGSEREAMIYSFTASDPSFIAAQRHFLFQPQRLNVAVTRARSKNILLVSESLTQTAARLAKEGEETAALFLDLLAPPTATIHGETDPQ